MVLLQPRVIVGGNPAEISFRDDKLEAAPSYEKLHLGPLRKQAGDDAVTFLMAVLKDPEVFQAYKKHCDADTAAMTAQKQYKFWSSLPPLLIYTALFCGLLAILFPPDVVSGRVATWFPNGVVTTRAAAQAAAEVARVSLLVCVLLALLASWYAFPAIADAVRALIKARKKTPAANTVTVATQAPVASESAAIVRKKALWRGAKAVALVLVCVGVLRFAHAFVISRLPQPGTPAVNPDAVELLLRQWLPWVVLIPLLAGGLVSLNRSVGPAYESWNEKRATAEHWRQNFMALVIAKGLKAPEHLNRRRLQLLFEYFRRWQFDLQFNYFRQRGKPRHGRRIRQAAFMRGAFAVLSGLFVLFLFLARLGAAREQGPGLMLWWPIAWLALRAEQIGVDYFLLVIMLPVMLGAGFFLYRNQLGESVRNDARYKLQEARFVGMGQEVERIRSLLADTAVETFTADRDAAIAEIRAFVALVHRTMEVETVQWSRLQDLAVGNAAADDEARRAASPPTHTSHGTTP